MYRYTRTYFSSFWLNGLQSTVDVPHVPHKLGVLQEHHIRVPFSPLLPLSSYIPSYVCVAVVGTFIDLLQCLPFNFWSSTTTGTSKKKSQFPRVWVNKIVMLYTQAFRLKFICWTSRKHTNHAENIRKKAGRGLLAIMKYTISMQTWTHTTIFECYVNIGTVWSG